MLIVGAKIRHKMPFITQGTTINLIMDNAGGARNARGNWWVHSEITKRIQHQNQASSTMVTRDECIRFQDLVQNTISSRKFQWRDPDTLAVSVRDAWENLPSDTILRVINRIPVVLQLIVDHNGENDLLETRRGLIPPPEEWWFFLRQNYERNAT